MNFILFYFPKKKQKIEEMMFFEICLPPIFGKKFEKISQK
jgi:hypothetical protein